MTDDLTSIHTCHAECPKPICVAQRTIATQQEAIDELFAGLREAHDQLWHLAKDPATNPWLIDTAALLSKHGERT